MFVHIWLALRHRLSISRLVFLRSSRDFSGCERWIIIRLLTNHSLTSDIIFITIFFVLLLLFDWRSAFNVIIRPFTSRDRFIPNGFSLDLFRRIVHRTISYSFPHYIALLGSVLLMWECKWSTTVSTRNREFLVVITRKIIINKKTLIYPFKCAYRETRNLPSDWFRRGA